MLKRKRAVISALKKKNEKTQNISKNVVQNFFDKTKFQSNNSKALTMMQVLHKKRKPWSPREKKIALSYYTVAPNYFLVGGANTNFNQPPTTP